MKNKEPDVSIVMTTYNHENFVGAAIESALNQTYTNFELIIVDDCSSDSTAKIILSYTDSRVRFFPNGTRQGPSVAFNNGAKQAKGKYLIFFSGDDICHPNRINAQKIVLEQGYGEVVFAIPEIIDTDGFVNQLSPFRNVFREFDHNQNLFKVLFYEHNFLCAPTAMMHLNVWKKFGGFHSGLIQLQDFEFWLRISGHGLNFSIVNTPLVQYRVLDDMGNLSKKSNDVRVFNEMQYIYRYIYDNINESVFYKHFGSDLEEFYAKQIRHSFRDLKNFIFLKHKAHFIRVIALNDILLQNQPNGCDKQYESFIPLLDLFDLSFKLDSLNINRCQELIDALIEARLKNL